MAVKREPSHNCFGENLVPAKVYLDLYLDLGRYSVAFQQQTLCPDLFVNRQNSTANGVAHGH